MKNYLLDTNIASHIIKGDMPAIRNRLVQIPLHNLFVSVVTQAELLYGVAKRGHPQGLAKRVSAFLTRVDVLPWTPEVANVYADLRAACESAGTPLASIDMMIAAHACALQKQAQLRGDTWGLVTRDHCFGQIPFENGLLVTDWVD